MNKKIIWIAVIIIVLVLVIVGTSKKSVPQTIRIGGAFILTGPSAIAGALQVNAATMAVDEINAAGGIDGKTVELIIEDSTTDPKTALNAYEALKLKGIKYIIADSSPVVSTIRPAAVKDGILIFTPAATTPAYFDGSNLSCRIALTAKNFGPGFTQLLEKKGYKNAVTLFPDNEYGRGMAEEFNKALAAVGGKVLAAEFFNVASGIGDYRTNITKLKMQQARADALVVIQTANTVETMLKQIKDLGWDKPIISDYYTIQNPALKNLSLADNIDFVDYQYSRDVAPNESEATKIFKVNYAAKYGSMPVYIAAGHYDVVKLIAEGIKNAGNEPQKVADYVSRLKNYKAVTGTLSFNDDCEVSRDMVFRSVRVGKVVELKQP